jgi:hypothetical protein
VLRYSIDFSWGIVKLRLPGSKEVGRYLRYAQRYGRVLVCERVFNETTKKLWDISVEAALAAGIKSAYVIRSMAEETIQRFVKFAAKRRISDDTSSVPILTKLFLEIWTDPSKQAKKERWAKIKTKHVDDGPPGGPDIVILSTAVKQQEKSQTEVLTFDHDLIVFEEEIEQATHVRVKNAWKL